MSHTLPLVLIDPPSSPYYCPPTHSPTCALYPSYQTCFPLREFCTLTSIFYHLNPCSRSTRLVLFIQYFNILNCSKSQRHHRMVEESSNASAAGNDNPPDTSNNTIADALNNLTHALATLQNVNKNTQDTSSHDLVLNYFAPTQTFDLSPRSGSTAFQLASELLNCYMRQRSKNISSFSLRNQKERERDTLVKYNNWHHQL